ncbi:conserved hypothetical protein [gamma proteobacterium HTCC5015]|nr:conserved hypothetical protein [gamma proteobacterium HTCC5015]
METTGGDAMTDKNSNDRSGLFGQVAGVTAGLSKSAVKSLGKRVGGLSLRIGKTIILTRDQLREFSPEQRSWMRRSGEAIRDARQVAGWTLDDLSDALDLEDKTLLKAIEQGTATVSFELILRLTSLLARHDPVPFLVSMIRGFNPQLWAVLEDWGLGHIPTMLERDRQWMNIYRRHEEARMLSENEFEKVLDFSRSAFEMALEFAKIEKDDWDED